MARPGAGARQLGVPVGGAANGYIG